MRISRDETGRATDGVRRVTPFLAAALLAVVAPNAARAQSVDGAGALLGATPVVPTAQATGRGVLATGSPGERALLGRREEAVAERAARPDRGGRAVDGERALLGRSPAEARVVRVVRAGA